MNKNDKLEDCEYSKIPTNDNIPVKGNDRAKYGYGVRHFQLALLLICLTVNIIGRGHMGVTIVAMTTNLNDNRHVKNGTILYTRRQNNTNLLEDDVDNMTEPIQKIDYNRTLLNTTKDEQNYIVAYDWSKSIQEMVLNAFFLGYLIMMFPMGMLCQRYGGKLPLQITLLVNGIVSIATPCLAIWGGWKAVCCCRLLQGLSQAGTYPSVQRLLAKWSSADERAAHSCIVYTGATIGIVVAYQIAGVLGASKWGWPSTFYVIGVICFLCLILLTVFVAASPQDHKSISEEEKNFLMQESNDGNNRKEKLKTPWRAIITSRPFWGVIATQMGSTVAFVFFFNQVPSYIHHVLGVDVKDSGLLSSLPYLVSVFTSLGFGWVSDYFTNHNILSVKNARRLSNSISQCGITFFLILTSYTTNTTIAVISLVLAMAAHMGIHSGWMVNSIDLAPNFSGILMATGGTISTLFIVITPIIVSQVVTDMTNVIQWRIMIYIIVGISLVTNAIFVLLISTDVEPWNYPHHEDKCIENIQEKIGERK